MRFVLRHGLQEVVVISRSRRARPPDLESAARLLESHIRNTAQLDALRAMLATDPERARVANGPPGAVFRAMAELILLGRFHLVLDGAMPSWDWPFPQTPSFPVGAADRLPPGRPLLGDAEESSADARPDPIIPPEYPALAFRESQAIRQAAMRFRFRLEDLRYRGHPAPPRSLVADEFHRLEALQAQALRHAAHSLRLDLEALAGPPGLPAPTSMVAPALTALTGGAAGALRDASLSLHVELRRLAEAPSNLGTPTSSVAPAIDALSAEAAGSLRNATQTLHVQLRRLAQPPTALEPPASSVAPALIAVSAAPAQALRHGIAALTVNLRALAAVPNLEAPEGVTAGTLRQTATVQGAALKRGTERLAARLAELCRP